MIVHGGLGFISRGFENGKKMVVVPRWQKFDEHTDDHQLQIVEEMKKYGNMIPVYDIKDLKKAIKEVKRLKVRKIIYKPTRMLNIVDRTLKEWEKSV